VSSSEVRVAEIVDSDSTDGGEANRALIPDEGSERERKESGFLTSLDLPALPSQ